MAHQGLSLACQYADTDQFAVGRKGMTVGEAEHNLD